jgi:phospholipid/cholesterol/gamma-HCH transport system ATP-binding protein
VLEIENFWKFYGGKPILRDITITIRKGETVGIIGKSGCGKSTLLRHISRLEDASTGEVRGSIRLRGEIDLLRLTEREILRKEIRGKHIGYLFQQSALFDFLNAEENLLWPLRENRLAAEEAMAEKVRKVLERVDLPYDGDFLARTVDTLSGGERKRLALARVLLLDPEFILYDEPTTGCDPPTVTELNKLMIRLKEGTGITAIVTSHDMKSIASVTDRIAMIRDGTICFEGTTREALEDAGVKAFMDGREPE